MRNRDGVLVPVNCVDTYLLRGDVVPFRHLRSPPWWREVEGSYGGRTEMSRRWQTAALQSIITRLRRISSYLYGAGGFTIGGAHVLSPRGGLSWCSAAHMGDIERIGLAFMLGRTSEETSLEMERLDRTTKGVDWSRVPTSTRHLRDITGEDTPICDATNWVPWDPAGGRHSLGLVPGGGRHMWPSLSGVRYAIKSFSEVLRMDQPLRVPASRAHSATTPLHAPC